MRSSADNNRDLWTAVFIPVRIFCPMQPLSLGTYKIEGGSIRRQSWHAMGPGPAMSPKRPCIRDMHRQKHKQMDNSFGILVPQKSLVVEISVVWCYPRRMRSFPSKVPNLNQATCFRHFNGHCIAGYCPRIPQEYDPSEPVCYLSSLGRSSLTYRASQLLS